MSLLSDQIRFFFEEVHKNIQEEEKKDEQEKDPVDELPDVDEKEEEKSSEEEPQEETPPEKEEEEESLLDEKIESDDEKDDEDDGIPESRPKQIDREEKDKNGVRRKKLYIAFIEWAKAYNPKNTFGSTFDKDVFNVTYPFVPHDMRYFYRLANPILCVLAGKLTFFQLSELRKINRDNKKLSEMMIFAATDKDLRVFSNKDGRVYIGTQKEDGSIKLGRALGNTFDTYLQQMIKKGDILNGPIEESAYSEDGFMADVKNVDDDDREHGYAVNGEELVPVYCIGKSYSDSELRNDGTQKDADELGSVGFMKTMYKLGRGDNYSHALISFNLELTDMYSFEGHGIVLDSIMNRDSWLGTKSIYIAVVFVKKAERDRMKRYVNWLLDHSEETEYAYGNFVKALLFKQVPKQDKRFFCSSFMACLLAMSDPKNLSRDYSRTRPQDVCILPRSFFLADVVDRNDLVKQLPELKKKVDAIFKEHEEDIREYNNELPRLKLKEAMDELKTSDKILGWVINKALKNTH